MGLPLDQKRIIEDTVQELVDTGKPGSMLMTKNVCNDLGLKGEERGVVSSFLYWLAKDGKLIKRGKAAKAGQGNIYQIPFPEDKDSLLFGDETQPATEPPVVEEATEPPVIEEATEPPVIEEEPGEELQLCHKCNSILDPLALGHSIISLLMTYDRKMDGVNEKFKEMADDHHELLAENTHLKQMIDQKNTKILELNKKLSAGVKSMNMHDFQSKLGTLPSK